MPQRSSAMSRLYRNNARLISLAIVITIPFKSVMFSKHAFQHIWTTLSWTGVKGNSTQFRAKSRSGVACLHDDKFPEVCVCNAQHCDTVEELGSLSANDVVYYQSSKGSDRLRRFATKFDTALDEEGAAPGWEIAVDPTETYQEILGFGGALTDAAAINVHSLDKIVQEKFFESYYGDTGIRYTLGRVPMASSDFSTHVYSYAEVQEDMQLEHFNIEVDFDHELTGAKLPFVLEAMAKVTGRKGSHSLQLFASPWAPPAWMTVENRTLRNPHLRDDCRAPWAAYFSKFLSEYAKFGVHFWGVTAENEPRGNLGTWQALKFTPKTQMEFIRDYLGPVLRRDHPTVKIMMFDDQRAFLPEWLDVVLGGNNSAAEYVDGIGLHWYASLNDQLLWLMHPFEKMKAAHERFPDKFLLATEACAGFIPVLDKGPAPGSWARAELYAFDIIHDLNAWAVGWTDWNIALDMKGGPNWAKNFVDSPILVDTSNQRFLKNPMFYALGHFSRFVVPGARRIKVTSTSGSRLEDALDAAAFITPDNFIVCIVLNRGKAARSVRFQLGSRPKTLTVPAHSIQTVIAVAGEVKQSLSSAESIFA